MAEKVRPKILHGFTGSVASTLSHKFAEAYGNEPIVKTVMTRASMNFNIEYWWFNLELKPQYDIPECIRFSNFDDDNEWNIYKKDGKVLHIELTKWADKFIIAPCSANTLAKIANGLCDNLLTCCARAWDFSKPMVIAPAMNNFMYNHPITKEHLEKIQSWGIKVIPPQEKKLFCGDYGIGGMANIEDIISAN